MKIISKSKYVNILAIASQSDNKNYYLDSEGYLYLPKKLNFVAAVFSEEDIGSPDYDTKFHYTNLKQDSLMIAE